MSKMGIRNRIHFKLSDTNDLSPLSDIDINAILRAADEVIGIGGRNIIAKILKGSHDKIVLEKELNVCPSYGFYNIYSLDEIIQRIDWMITNNYFKIEYNGKLPVIVFSDKGWETYKPVYRDEIYDLMINVKQNDYPSIIERLKKTNRQVIELLLHKIGESKDIELLDILVEWEKIEVKKVREMIDITIEQLK